MTGKMNKAKSMKTRHILPHLAVKGMMNNGAAYYPYLAAGVFFHPPQRYYKHSA